MGPLTYSPTETKGVLAVHAFFNNVLGWIYRPGAEHDFGVDGEVELTDAALKATGTLLKVQVKSGSSYFIKGDDQHIWFYVSKEKMDYWNGHSLPVLLALHDPDSERTYWTRVSKATSRRTKSAWRINVPRNQLFANSSKAALEAIARERSGPHGGGQAKSSIGDPPTASSLAEAVRKGPAEPATGQAPAKVAAGPQGAALDERPLNRADPLAIEAALEAMSWKQVLSLAAAHLGRGGDAPAGPRGAEDPALHARIDTLRDLDRAGSPRVAYEQLQSLLETIDRTATPHAFFRAQSNLASAALDLGRVEEAAANWEAAYESEPANPHAIATLGLARLIQGRIPEARLLAEQAMSGPAPEKAGVSVLFQALARDETWNGDPEALIPDALRSTLDADLGRVEFKRRRRDPSWREAAIEAAERHPDEEVFRYSAAHAVLDMASPFHDPAHPIDQRVHRPDLEAAAKLLAERADAWLRDDYRDLYELEAYANNAAVAYRLLGKFDQARSLIDRTLAVHPGMLGLRKLQGVIEAMDGDKGRAIELLSLVPQDGEAQLYRAELISQDEPREALTALLDIPDEIVPVEHKTTRWLITGSIALRLRDRAILDRAIAQITLDPPRALFADVFEIEWEARHGLEPAEVKRRLLDVAGQLDDDTTLPIRASLADLLCRHQLYFEASECLEGYVGFSQPDEVTLLYLQALASSRRDKRLLAAISQASDLVRNDPAVIRIIALHAYNAGELVKAEAEARKLVKAQDGELGPVLLLLDVLARRDERRAIAKVLSRDLEGLKADGLDERLKLARYLFAFGDRDRALRYSYWLSWRYRDDRRALMAQCFQTLEATRVGAQTSYDALIAADDVCVEIRTDDETIRFVIEPDASLRQLSDRAWEPSHPLVQSVLGKAVEDLVELPDGETGQIVSITHKFISRMQEAFQTLHRRFPNNPGFQRFKVDPDAPDGFDKFYAKAKEQTATVDAALEDYKAGRSLVSMLAMQLGSSALDVVEGMKFDGPRLVNAAGSIAERQAAGDALTASAGKGFVIDTATFWCLWRLKAVDAVVQVLGKMHVSSTIFDELATRRDFLEPHAQEGLQQFGHRNGRPTLTETSAEAIRNGIALVEDAIAWLKANARVCPAHTPETLPDNIARTVGQMRFHFLDELFIALNEDLLLLSDDLRLRAMASELGVARAAWTQWTLVFAAEQGAATLDEYIDWSAQLVAMGHIYIAVTPDLLLRALRRDEKEGVSRTPAGRFYWLVRALGGGSAEPVSHLRVLCAVIGILWRRRELLPVREFATGLLLERLVVERDDSAILINAVGEVFEREPRVLAYIGGWLRGHFLAPW